MRDSIAVSEFKATCLRVLEQVRKTGQTVLITKHGQPLAQVGPPPPPKPTGSRLGVLRGTGKVLADIYMPPVDPKKWEEGL